MHRSLSIILAMAVGGFTADKVAAQEVKTPGAVQLLPEPYQQVSVEHQGRELTRYHYGPALRRPFFYPVVGPQGRSLTRMGQPSDPIGHNHQNSLWIAHQNVAGVNFWEDTGGRIVHRKIESFSDGDHQAVLVSHNDWVDADDRVLLQERRTSTFRPLSNGEWLLQLDLSFTSPEGSTELGESAFGMVAVRVARPLGVTDGGGVIRNSEGQKNEAEAFRKPARWVDYSGAITATEQAGLTLLDHPKNFNHPSVFHIRDNGWMGASTTFGGPKIVTAEPLELRYAVYVHGGVPTPEALDAVWQDFAGQKPAARAE